MKDSRPQLRHAPPDAITDRRAGRDRRGKHLKAFLYQFVEPRRRHSHRRAADRHPFHVDIHEPALLAVVLITLSLCVVDVYATLTLLEKGGQELNPLMKQLIDRDVWLFFVVKYVMTAAGLFVLLSYRRFRFFRGLSGLHSLRRQAALAVSLLAASHPKMTFLRTMPPP